MGAFISIRETQTEHGYGVTAPAGFVYTAVTKNEHDWWVGWIEEVPGVNCQERTHQELVVRLNLALKEALEFNRQDALN